VISAGGARHRRLMERGLVIVPTQRLQRGPYHRRPCCHPGPTVSVLIVDDGSPDGTGGIEG
jgi:hypothetical protein